MRPGSERDAEAALPVPHAAVAVAPGESAGGRGASHGGERHGVDADARHLLLQGRQLVVLHEAEDVQQAQGGQRLTQIPAELEHDVESAELKG